MSSKIIVEDDDMTSIQEVYQDKMISSIQQGIMPVVEPTELGESLRELNNDEISDKSNYSAIDMRSRLHFAEISGILAIDTLVAFGYLPTSISTIPTVKKRLSVSKNGEGRKEIVDITCGKRETDVRKGGGISSWFQPKEKTQ